MTTRKYQIEITAPIEVVFDLCRSIDFHLEAAQSIRARAISGQTTGLAEEGTMTVYSAAFFGCRFRLAMEISDFRYPTEFRDIMKRGLFTHFSHHYRLSATPAGCCLQDTLSVEIPFGIVGRAMGRTLIFPSLEKAQQQRLSAIKRKAERS